MKNDPIKIFYCIHPLVEEKILMDRDHIFKLPKGKLLLLSGVNVIVVSI